LIETKQHENPTEQTNKNQGWKNLKDLKTKTKQRKRLTEKRESRSEELKKLKPNNTDIQQK